LVAGSQVRLMHPFGEAQGVLSNDCRRSRHPCIYRIRRPGTRRKSAVLRVSRVRWWTSAVADISASGILRPIRLSSAAFSATRRSTTSSSIPASSRRAAGKNSIPPAKSSARVTTEYANLPLLGRRFTDSRWSMQTSVSTSREATVVPLVPAGNSFPDSLCGTKGGVEEVVVIVIDVRIDCTPNHLRHGGVRAPGDLVDTSPLLIGQIDLGTLCHIQHAVYSTSRRRRLRDVIKRLPAQPASKTYCRRRLRDVIKRLPAQPASKTCCGLR